MVVRSLPYRGEHEYQPRMEFPWVRIRRLRRTPSLRRLSRSIRQHPDELVPNLRIPVEDPGRAAESLAERALDAGHHGLYLSPSVRRRDTEGSEAWRADSPLAQALYAARAAAPELAIFAELDLAVYHRTGRPALVSEGLVDAEAAHESIGKVGVTLGEAGADVLALRGQVDGGVGALREALDEAGLDRVGILSFSGDMYSPFTELRPRTAEKAADLLDPMDPGSVLRQAECDIADGADMLGIQPTFLALDLLRDLAEEHQHPLVARITEQEAKVLESAARSGLTSMSELAMVVHCSLIRAGARLVVTPWCFDETGSQIPSSDFEGPLG